MVSVVLIAALVLAVGPVSCQQSAIAGNSKAQHGSDVWQTFTSMLLTNKTISQFSHSLGEAAPNSLQDLLVKNSSSWNNHKPLYPLNGDDILMFVIACVSIFIAAGGGIGGGGVLVPLYLIVGQFSTPQAVALSNITIMGGSIANFWCNVRRKHPKANRPLIDWDLILVMEPATIVGAIVGGYLNKLIPVWLTTVLLAVLLTLMTHKLLAKGKTTFDAESQLLALDAALDSPSRPLLDGVREEDLEHSPAGETNGGYRAPEDGYAPDLNGNSRSVSSEEDALIEVLTEEAAQIPIFKLLVLLFVSGWVVTSDTLKEEVPCGSWRYWLVVLSILPCIAVVTVEMRRYLLWKVAVKTASGHYTFNDELNWTPLTTLLYPAFCSLAGLVAGLFGVGGGIVKGPLMLELGVAPEVAAATAATMIMFTAGAASVVFIHFGGVVWDYAGVLFCLGFLVTLVGQLMTYRIVHALGRRSVIIFMMGTLLAMATLVMYYQVTVSFIRHPHGPWWRTGHICPTTK